MIDKPFGRALHDLLVGREEFSTLTGNVNWRLVADSLDGVHYESLRKCVAADRQPTVDLIEKVAALAGVSPDYFVEYELAEAMRAFDVKQVGFDEARANLTAFRKALKH